MRTVLDLTVGTGGMLSTAQDHLMAPNPDAHLEVARRDLIVDQFLGGGIGCKIRV